jgi:hypothetical protein
MFTICSFFTLPENVSKAEVINLNESKNLSFKTETFFLNEMYFSSLLGMRPISLRSLLLNYSYFKEGQ